MFDPQEAARPGAPLVHETLDSYIKTFECERGGNILATIAMAEGDVDKAWADCDVIVEGVFETASPEPRLHRAEFGARRGRR